MERAQLAQADVLKQRLGRSVEQADRHGLRVRSTAIVCVRDCLRCRRAAEDHIRRAVQSGRAADGQRCQAVGHAHAGVVQKRPDAAHILGNAPADGVRHRARNHGFRIAVDGHFFARERVRPVQRILCRDVERARSCHHIRADRHSGRKPRMLLGLLCDLLCHFRSLVCVLLRERVVTDAVDLLITVAVITQLLLEAAHRVACVRGVVTVLHHECGVSGHRHLRIRALAHAQRLAVVGERLLHLRVPLADLVIVGLLCEQALRFPNLRFSLIDLPRERERLLLALGIVRVRAPGCHARHIPALPFDAGNLVLPRADLRLQLVRRPVIHLVLVQPVIFCLGSRRVLELRERRIDVRAGLTLVFLRVGV